MTPYTTSNGVTYVTAYPGQSITMPASGTVVVTVASDSTSTTAGWTSNHRYSVTPVCDPFDSAYRESVIRARAERRRALLLAARRHCTPQWLPHQPPAPQRRSQPSKCR